jgi:hypothetical protein
MDTPIENVGETSAGRPSGSAGDAQAAVASSDAGRPSAGSQAAPMTRRPIPPKLYKIGEVAAYAQTSRQTIHNYTTMGLIQESRWSEGGHRLYDETVFPRLDEILGMKAQRRSLKEIRESFLGRDDGPKRTG